MNIYKFLLVCVSFIFLSCSMKEENKMVDYTKFANFITINTAKEVEAKYEDVKLFGEGGSMADCISKMTMHFAVYKRLSKDEARKILIEISEMYLENINSNEEVRPYLSNYPFTEKNIDVALFLFAPHDDKILHPDIKVASLHDGLVSFKTNNITGYGYKSKEKESYEEAFKKVKESKEEAATIDYTKFTDVITAQTAKELEPKYKDFKLVGKGGAMANQVSKMSMSFEIRKKLNKDETRKFIVDVAEKHLKNINSNEEIKPFLSNYPFTTKNLELMLFMFHPDGSYIIDPDLAYVYLSDESILFVKVKKAIYGLESIEKETYGEALEIVKKNHPEVLQRSKEEAHPHEFNY